MKKVAAVLWVLLFCVVCVPLSAHAAEKEEMVPIAVKVPESWGTPNLWAWADDGTNAFAAWPGEAMEPLAEGWYYLYVPSFVQHVIINANQDTAAPVQTEDVAVEAGAETWITVAEDNTAVVEEQAQLRGEIPAYVEKFVVHAYVPLSWKTVDLWAWSAPDGTNAFAAWPGEPMKEGEDGWFTGKAPTWVNSLIVSGNGGEVQTADIAVSGAEVWITVYEDLTYELSDQDPNKAVDDITVHAKIPADWSGPCCWAWSAPDGTNAFAAWPGEPMVQEEEWYTIAVPGWINSVIVNANESAVQTADIAVEAGKDIWVVVTDAENVAVTYEEPAAEAEQPVEDPAPTVEEPTAESNGAADETAQKQSHTGLILICCVAAAGLIGVAAVVVRKRKK